MDLREYQPNNDDYEIDLIVRSSRGGGDESLPLDLISRLCMTSFTVGWDGEEREEEEEAEGKWERAKID